MMYLGNNPVGLNNSSIQYQGNALPQWEYINTITTQEDTDLLMCTTDYAGNSISLKGFAVFIYSGVSTQVTGNKNLYIGINPRSDIPTGTSSTYEIITIQAGIRTTEQTNFAWGKIEGIINDARSTTAEPATNQYTTLIDAGGTTDTGGGRRGAITINTTYGDGYIHSVYAQGQYFGPGSFMRVYGIKS